MVYIAACMKILFNRTVVVDVSNYPYETLTRIFNRNEILEVSEIIPVSRGFVNISLPPGNPIGDCLIDVRKDSFKEIG